jgi:hydroxyacylglutathione hydrolase
MHSTRESWRVWLVPALSDNLIPVLERGPRAVVVDPALAEPVAEALEQRGLELVAILQTHHHHDHIGGTAELLRRWPGAEVIASAADRARIPLQTRGVVDGDRFPVLARPVEVMEVPGHTSHHLAYYLPSSNDEPGELFCGDTLFSAGCGRLFEGTPSQMHRSLARLGALPPSTRVWCAHEYTESNLRWAVQELAGDHPAAGAVRQRLQDVRQRRAGGGFSIPSTIGLERQTNLFLMAGDATALARLRRSKDNWRG